MEDHRSSDCVQCTAERHLIAADEIAQLFDATSVQPGNAAPGVYPGYPGLVFARGELRRMVWGFPLVMKGKSGQPLKPKPVNNTRATGSTA